MISSRPATLGTLTNRHYGLVPKEFDANIAFRKDILLMAGTDRAAAAQLKTMCKEDVLFYINTFCWTYSPKDSISGYPLTPFITYGFQDEVIMDMLDAINKGIDVATPKSRGVGASWMGLTAIEWCWHFRDYLSFLMVSRKQDLVDDSGNPGSLMWKIDFLHRHQPKWLTPPGRERGNKDPNRRLMHIGNAETHSVIDGESTTGNVGVGDRRTCIFFDEFALLEEGYAALSGSRDVTNCRIFNSTPRGQNHFHEVCERVAAKVIRMHWSRHELFRRGLYTTDETTGRVRLLDDFKGTVLVREKGEKAPREVRFPEEYPFKLNTRFKIRSPWFDYECTRCANEKEIAQELELDFLGSDYQFFDPELIDILKKKYCLPPLLIGDLEYDATTLEPKRFREHEAGRLELWLTVNADGRIAKDRKFVVGSDVSAGTGASNSVTSVVDRDSGEKIAVWRDPNVLPDTFSEQSIAIAKWFNGAFMIWDRSGPTGETFTKTVIRNGYGNIYYRRIEKKVGRNITDEPGYFINPQAKTVLFQDYRAALADHRFINRSLRGMDECLQFIRKVDGSIEHAASVNAAKAKDPTGARLAHGDEAVADALACLGLDEQQQGHEAESPEIPVGSLAWRRQQQNMIDLEQKSDRLGAEW